MKNVASKADSEWLTVCSVACLFAVILAFSLNTLADSLQPATEAAFDRYVQLSEGRMHQDLQVGSFLWADTLLPAQRDDVVRRLQRGEVVTQKLETLDSGASLAVPGGLIHHWIGTVFVPGATLDQTLTLLQDYDQHFRVYSPNVVRSRLIRRDRDDFKIYLQLRQKKVITVILDSEYDVHYSRLDATRATSRSSSVRINEVETAGESDERVKPAGKDNGYLWRLNSYWRLWERDGGVYVQLEAISLTRSIPEGLGWLVRPFVTSIPEESLAFTLGRTRDALVRPRGAAPTAR
jgi:hypothetical protein